MLHFENKIGSASLSILPLNSGPKQSSIDLFFRLDAKLRFIYENVDHMVDFRISSFDPIQQNTNKLKDVVNSSQIRNHS